MKPLRKQIAFDIDQETHQRIKICAVLEDISMNLLMHKAILIYLRDKELVILKKSPLG